MPRRDPDLLIEDILNAIGKIERYTTGLDQGQFQQDEKTLDAVVRNLEIVGEAARQLPEEFAAQYSEVPWNQIRGLRNRIVHTTCGLISTCALPTSADCYQTPSPLALARDG